MCLHMHPDTAQMGSVAEETARTAVVDTVAAEIVAAVLAREQKAVVAGIGLDCLAAKVRCF